MAAEAELNLENACNLFMDEQLAKFESGALSAVTYRDYRLTSENMCRFWGVSRGVETLTPTEFTAYRNNLTKTNNPVSVGNAITRVKTILNWLHASKLCEQLDFGPDFKKPGAKIVRRHKKTQAKKLFTARQIHAIMDEAGLHLRAMLYLGINCGYGNNDCNTLPLDVAKTAVETGWLEYARPKTEIDRRCPLWPETIRALKRSLARRVASDLPNAFIKPNGTAYCHANNDISKKFRIARQGVFIRNGGFYWLRSTFETWAGESKDQVAVDSIMGWPRCFPRKLATNASST